MEVEMILFVRRVLAPKQVQPQLPQLTVVEGRVALVVFGLTNQLQVVLALCLLKA
jgi:hypothetical protein